MELKLRNGQWDIFLPLEDGDENPSECAKLHDLEKPIVHISRHFNHEQRSTDDQCNEIDHTVGFPLEQQGEQDHGNGDFEDDPTKKDDLFRHFHTVIVAREQHFQVRFHGHLMDITENDIEQGEEPKG